MEQFNNKWNKTVQKFQQYFNLIFFLSYDIKEDNKVIMYMISIYYINIRYITHLIISYTIFKNNLNNEET